MKFFLLLFHLVGMTLIGANGQATNLTLPDLVDLRAKTVDEISRSLLNNKWELYGEDVDTAAETQGRTFIRDNSFEALRITWYNFFASPNIIEYVDGRSANRNTLFYLDALKWLNENGYRLRETKKGETTMEDLETISTMYSKKLSRGFAYVEVVRFMKERKIVRYKYWIRILGA